MCHGSMKALGGKPFFLLAMAGEEMLGMIPRVGLRSGELILTAGSFGNIQWYRDCRALYLQTQLFIMVLSPCQECAFVTAPGRRQIL